MATKLNRYHSLNMPQLLSGGLSENWLLKELGDIHWGMISKGLGTTPDSIIDSNGDRLYASFVRLRWQSNESLFAFKESDGISIEGELSGYGNKMFFSNDKITSKDKVMKASLMSVFSSRASGNNEKLTKGQPLNSKNLTVKKLTKLPELAKGFFDTKTLLFSEEDREEQKLSNEILFYEQEFVIHKEPLFTKSYQVDPYDDINGVGLLYFASYPKINDKCERFFFDQYGNKGQANQNWAENGYCIARDIHYYGNANANDELLYELEDFKLINNDQIQLTSSLYRSKNKQLIAKVFTVKKMLDPITVNFDASIGVHIKKEVQKKEEHTHEYLSKDHQEKERVYESTNSGTKSYEQLVGKYSREELNGIIHVFLNKIFEGIDIGFDTDLRHVGIESIVLTELSEHLNVTYDLSSNPSKFFGLYSINSITSYLLREEIPVKEVQKEAGGLKENNEVIATDEIAIIGVSCRLPGANTKEEFWDNLSKGISSITSTPTDRWEWPDWIDLDKEHKGINKGGYIKDIDKFDPLFFGIPPVEAEIIDPQQRLLLELTWELLEDSGHKPSSYRGSDTGVFIGVSGSDYELLLNKNQNTKTLTATGSSTALLSNRISYFYDLQGPSLSIDTACSSSLVAINEAIKSISQGECSQAIVGGIHIMCDPSRSLSYQQSNMLSVDGKCHTFDSEANGYVRGEGAVMLLLKPLSTAVSSTDRILGVIKGAAVNHGGNSLGLTVPDPKRQQELIKEAYLKANVPVSSVSYIEAHGTGTPLGDPIEIAGLTSAFKGLKDKNTKSSSWCGIGSVKTNIGHLEAASGMAGVLKVLLSMKNKFLPATRNFNNLNPKIELEGSPFYVQNEASVWSSSTEGTPLRAGVSGFGIGGANAHVVIEEYIQEQTNYKSDDSAIILLSAKNDSRLRDQANNLLTYIQENGDVNLHDIAYTLQVGREAMDERLSCIASDLETVKNHLIKYIEGKTEGLFVGNIKRDKNDFILEGEAGKAYIQTAISKQQTKALAQLWVKGVAIDWKLLYSDTSPNKVSLPTYPFAKKRYWIPSSERLETAISKVKLHPLLHVNRSNLKEQRFTNIYTGQELFLSDHSVRKEKVLPGVAYLELAREAGSISLEKSITQLRDITWLSPIRVNGSSQQVEISLFEEGDFLGYEVYSGSGTSETIHGQGKISTTVLAGVERLDIENLKGILSNQKSKVDCYGLFQELGFDYGNSFQGIEKLYYGDDGALSKITLPKEDGYVLQPGILDSAFQTCIGLGIQADGSDSLRLPFSVKEVNIYGDTSTTTWCYARKNKNTKQNGKVRSYDIALLNDKGDVLLQFKNFVTLPIDGSQKGSSTDTISKEELKLQLYSNTWTETPIVDLDENSISNSLIVLSGDYAVLAEKLQESLGEEVIAINEDTELRYYQKIQEITKSRLESKEAITLTVLYCNTDYVDYSFISGLLKTAEIEAAKFQGKTIGVPSLSVKEIESLIGIIKSEESVSGKEVRYIGDKREVRKLSTLSTVPTAETAIGIKEGGVYLITGGTGGLGQIFANHINKTKDTKLILTGRSQEGKLSKKELKSLDSVYRSCDITDKEAIGVLVDEILSDYGKLDGIIHSAGVIKDSFLLKKEKEESALVLNPKISGTKYLDEYTKDLDLDFMMYFSSITGVLGNLGQGDYSSANAWLDNYASYRNELVSKGKRQGHTISINWPLWKDGGMQIDADSEKHFLQHLGILPLATFDGISAFDTLLGCSLSQGIVMYGYPSLMAKKIETTTNSITKEYIKVSTSDSSFIEEQVTSKIINLVSDLLKLDIEDITIDEDLGDYGFDSILFTKFSNELNHYYDLDIMPTLFYSYPTIEELAGYLSEDYFDKLVNKHDVASKAVIVKTTNIPDNSNLSIVSRRSRFLTKATISEAKALDKEPNQRFSERVAIVGISGRFPGSPDLNTFWENIRDNKDLITEVPKDRWDWKEYYGDAKKETGKTKAKWGGFIEDMDKFDPLFFNISPREAELMDPQQRITLESVYQALENANIDASAIKGSNTGVFVGVSSSDYSMLLGKQKDLTNQGQYPTGAFHSLLANRISYLLDLHGPSEPIDTACSSSLIAIHRAVESIRLGHCNVAIAGGVNALLSPDITLAFSQAGMLSEDGRCKTFDERANGYVRAEGVGMIVLKSLSQAEADGDHIYGVIRGTSENHGGKANTLTSPNPNAQKELLLKAYRSSGIDPRDVSYIEAHGTGTPLGDPIEIEALKLAFKELYKENNLDTHEYSKCGIGSVKTNIGHLEGASGIAGVMKVLLSLQHKTIPGNVHLKNPNEYLKLADSPFYLEKETREWSITNDKPRLAGVSSFGFGGVNAHIIIEEYVSKQKVAYTNTSPAIILLSAKNDSRLKDRATNLLTYIQENGDVNLHDIAYTLQVGREAMDERLSCIASDLETVKNHLIKYIEGKTEGLFVGNIKKDKNDFLLEGEAGKAYIQTAISKQQTKALAQLWVKGVAIDWNLLYVGIKPNKINLPTYSFARERYWVPQSKAAEVSISGSKIHPLLHANVSDFKEQKYSSVYTGKEPFLYDHKVSEDKVLPGVAYLELVREAALLSSGFKINQFRNVSWTKPILVKDKEVEVQVNVYPREEGIEYKVSSNTSEELQIHSEGVLFKKQQSVPSNYNIDEILSQFKHFKNKEECYSLIRETGMNYGFTYRGVEKLWYNSSAALSKIVLTNTSGFVLPPGLMDSALHTAYGMTFLKEEVSPILIPFSIKELNIYRELPETVWSYVRKQPNSKVACFDIDVLNEKGEVLLCFKDLILLPVAGSLGRTSEAMSKTCSYGYDWAFSPEIEEAQGLCDTQLVLVAGGTEEQVKQLHEKLKTEVQIIPEKSEQVYFINLIERLREALKSDKKVNVILIYENHKYLNYSFVSGFLKSVMKENPKISGKIIGVNSFELKDVEILGNILKREQTTSDIEVRYLKGKREVRKFKKLDNSHFSNERIQIKEGGVYLITGGAGGLGLIFARHLSKTKDVKLILLGRSILTSEKERMVKQISGAEYHKCDITNKKELEELIHEVRQKHSTLDGIVHSAGVAEPRVIFDKTETEIDNVLSPKIIGTRNLDEVTEDISLDFMVFFSSISGLIGDIGLSDYAAANAFLDSYAVHRNDLVKKGMRKGRTLTINWPLWNNGGMQINEESQKYLENKWGMLPLPTEEGIRVFDDILNSSLTQILIVHGHENKISKNLIAVATEKKKMGSSVEKSKHDIEDIKSKATTYFSNLFIDELKLNETQLDVSASFDEYGIESVMIIRLTNILENIFGTIPSTLFFEYRTLEELIDYFIAEHAVRIQELTNTFSTAENKSVGSIKNMDYSIALATEKKKMGSSVEKSKHDIEDIKSKATTYFSDLFIDELKLNETQLDVSASFDEYGIESVMIIRLTNILENIFGTIPSTLFFEYRTLEELIDYFIAEHAVRIQELTNTTPSINEKKDSDFSISKVLDIKNRFVQTEKSLTSGQPDELMSTKDIAIIGLSGRYPGANTMNEFWENLKNGTDSITEFPSDRWDVDAFYDEEKGKKGKSYTKRGGFIDDIDKFDPLFFKISPNEAKMMDPQERIFLQTVWETIEDAGYTKKRLKKEKKIGVYAGIMFEDYSLVGLEAQQQNEGFIHDGISANLANRVSYFFDFKGPSLTLNTMCSSSLVAIHMACQGLLTGDADMAIAGGANVAAHPNKFLMLCQKNFLSSRGKCESFGDKGNGYASAEGIGAVLLKPLAKAKADGDRIYGVIKGTSINHGGKVNGYTVPNLNAQADLVKEAIQRAGVKVEDFSYMEAHGTGTSLGDPIEIAGLTKAFQAKKKQYCSIGSVKSNIGHCEAAAGISGLTKVLLQMKHKQLVPSLHSEILNPKIDFINSPFKVQQGLTDWVNEHDRPRLSAVSSFGAGGSNAHLIIEEYPTEDGIPYVSQEPTLIILSAKNKERLQEHIQNIKNYLEVNKEENLYEIAYTLQKGREAMEERLAFIAKDIESLKNILSDYLKGNGKGVIAGNIKTVKKEQQLQGGIGIDAIEMAIQKKDIQSLAQFWVKGKEIDWDLLYSDHKPKKISLPNYPFAKERYWFPKKEKITKVQSIPAQTNLAPVELQNDQKDRNSIEVVQPEKLKSDSPVNVEIVDNVHFVPQWEPEILSGLFGEQGKTDQNISIFVATDDTSIIEKIKENSIADQVFQLPFSKDIATQVANNTLQLFEYCKDLVKNKKSKLEKVLVYVPYKDTAFPYRSLMGLLRSISLESPFLKTKLLFDFALYSNEVNTIKKHLFDEINFWDTASEVLYTQNESRSVLKQKQINILERDVVNSNFKKDGVYVITGGLGGLGQIFAKHIGKNTEGAQIILTGRSLLTDGKQEVLNQLLDMGIQAHYIPCDINNKVEVEQMVEDMILKFGAIHGIIHTAGLIKDNYCVNKTNEELLTVLSPKVRAVTNLDEATKALSLDFFALFSSVASFGSAGQIDYASGNAFMDIFAEYREQLLVKGERLGKTVSINWPLWKDGGMNPGEFYEEAMFKNMGMLPLETEIGIQTFNSALTSAESQLGIISGDANKILEYLKNRTVDKKKESKNRVSKTDITESILESISKILGVEKSNIDVTDPLTDYGVDSVVLMQLSDVLNATYDFSFTGASFFELDTVELIAEHLYNDEDIQKMYDQEIKDTEVVVPIVAEEKVLHTQKEKEKEQDLHRLAVIGYDCKFPGADSPQEFWENITNKVVSVKSIEQDEWEKRGVICNGSYNSMKYASLMDNIGQFDASFWGIDPEIAKEIDPQLRILLQNIWHGVEHSGYSVSKFTEQKVGVFIAADSTDYETILKNENKAPSLEASMSVGMLANKVSYYCDFNGPSQSLDNSCSSVYAVLGQAQQAIKSGACDVAIVASVKILLDPVGFLTREQLLSKSGQMRSFDEKADGYVRGEGVGCLILKTEAQAKKDQDTIHAIVSGTSVTHNGNKGLSSMAPSVDAQYQAIDTAYGMAGILPETVHYIEAHGTATAFNDAAEIAAYKKFFKASMTEDIYKNHRCAISTVKPNIGHLEGASGIASIMKAILALKHKQIPPTAAFSTPHPSLFLKDSTFYIPTELSTWKAGHDHRADRELPRRVGLHSVGIGGVNAHVILEENTYTKPTNTYNNDDDYDLIVISAKSKKALIEYKKYWLNYLASIHSQKKERGILLANMAYSSQVTREAMPYKQAFVVNTIESLKLCLQETLDGDQKRETNTSYMITNVNAPVTKQQGIIEEFSEDRSFNYLKALSEDWIGGKGIDWQCFSMNQNFERIPIPVYPFENKEYWLGMDKKEKAKKIEDKESIFESLFYETFK